VIDLPVHYLPMPVNADGDGPSSADETVRVIHQVWDPHCNTICEAPTEELARFIVECVNATI
jgi:hypothetical protein